MREPRKFVGTPVAVSLWKRLRNAATRESRPMKEILTDSLEEYLTAKEKKRK
jgi:hypothetical protein